MSQLIDKLNRIAKPAAQPLGFRTTQASVTRAQMLLVASLSSSESLNGLANSEADAVLVQVALDTKAMQKLARSLGEIPWGVTSKAGEEKEIKTIVEAGGDFVVFPTVSPVSAMPQGNKLGKVLRVESSLAEGLLRAVNDLPVDAVLVADEPGNEKSLTWQHLMLFQRAAALLAKPVLVSVPLNLTAGELQTLWDIGVDGVVVEVGKGQADKLAELKRAISGLTNNSPKRKQGKTGVLVPTLRVESPAESEEGPEEDE